jgi:hypothetical protein
MYEILTHSLRALNSFLTAGIAITAFSLLLYALSFNLRDRVARTFAFILICVVIVFVGEAFSTVAKSTSDLEFWQHIQWVGIIFLPAAYMHLSDALLSTTGRPSRGRRRLLVRLMYLASFGFLALMISNMLVGPLILDTEPAPHLQRTWLTWVFSAYYLLAMVLSWMNFWRAYQRTVTSATRRRMSYLIIGALAPALGSYPYLLFGSELAIHFPLIFWLTVTLGNLFVTFLLVLMAYGVAFFGVSWPDRVIKRRLFKWIMRGPVTASTVLVITTVLKRMGTLLAIDLSAAIPVFMTGSILLMEHMITLAAPIWERRLFYGKDRPEMELLQTLDERLLTLGDLQQFLEAILAAVCDRLQVSKAFIATLGSQGMETLIMIGGDTSLEQEDLPVSMIQAAAKNGKERILFTWGDHLLVPLFGETGSPNELIGLLGVAHKPDLALDDEQADALQILAGRAAMAINDRYKQEQVFSSLEELTPQMEWIQELRAASRYDGTEILATPDFALEQSELSPLVKDALTHYWGGPKLTGSPLLDLQVVRKIARDHEETSTNALRTLLRNAIEQVRPEGERRFTAEWILYNILELKFMEGRKVREVAMRLAMSEADLYRKQRVAIEEVAKAILEMEQEVRRETSVEIETNGSFHLETNEFTRGGNFNGNKKTLP